MIKVFIADDEEPARERLKELLGDIAEEVLTSVVGEARNGLETLEPVARLPHYRGGELFGDVAQQLLQPLARRLLVVGDEDPDHAPSDRYGISISTR